MEEILSRKSRLELERLKFEPPLPELLRSIKSIEGVETVLTLFSKDSDSIQNLFPKTFGQPFIHFHTGDHEKTYPSFKVGVVFSGGQAPGGHNVVAGLFDALKRYNSNSILIGFLAGPNGIIENQSIELTKERVDNYRNTGGFDLLGSGRTKIETPEQLEKSMATAQAHKLDGLVVVGGDDSNTNAAIMAEYFLSKGCTTKVIGVPKTIDGDLKNPFIEISFGFDTACKVYAEMIGNIAKDALSAKKYWHFIKLMGRSASHVTLECALETHPNITLIGEEIDEKKMTLEDISKNIADVICKRSEAGKNYGIALIPEGLIEFIPEVKVLIKELNLLEGKNPSQLSSGAKATFDYFPKEVAEQLLLDRDPHGNIQVSHIATEKLLIHTVEKELKKRPDYKGKFNSVSHFFGYEGRSGFPSNFDATYCYALGFVSAALIAQKVTGYLALVQKLAHPVDDWKAGGIPINALMHIEERKGRLIPVIKKSLVDLQGEPFQTLIFHRELWSVEDHYCSPGPIQYLGATHTSDETTFTLLLEQHQKVSS